MIRAAAKNHGDVAVVVDPDDYQALMAELDGPWRARPRARFGCRLAQRAFARTAAYDAAIANWLAAATDAGTRAIPDLRRPARGQPPIRREPAPVRRPLPVGRAAAGRRDRRASVQGKALSYNNIADADAALELVAEFDPGRTAAVAIIKHANPCGVAEGTRSRDAYRGAPCAAIPVSAFGGIVAVNRTLDGAAARAVTSIFTEVIVAPDADEEALRIVAAKKNLRLLADRRPA